MKRLFDLLGEVTTMWLSEGCRVETPFGSFAPRLKLLGDHTDPDKVLGRDVIYNGIEFIPSRQFVNDADCSLRGFRRMKTCVGNSQMYNPKAMEEALRQSCRNGYTTISTFMMFSHLKRKSAKAFLDSLCVGEKPLLRCYREGRTWHYVVLRTIIPVKKISWQRVLPMSFCARCHHWQRALPVSSAQAAITTHAFSLPHICLLYP